MKLFYVKYTFALALKVRNLTQPEISMWSMYLCVSKFSILTHSHIGCTSNLNPIIFF